MMNPPTRLKGEARKKWKEVFASFVPRSALEIDQACVYCDAYADLVAADKIIAAEGEFLTAGKNGVPYPHPAASKKKQAYDRMHRIAKLLKDRMAETVKEDGGFFG